MKPIAIVGNDLQPLFQYAIWIGNNNDELPLANTIGISNYRNELVYYYLQESTVKEYLAKGELIEVNVNKLISLIALSDNPVDVISQFIDAEEGI